MCVSDRVEHIALSLVLLERLEHDAIHCQGGSW